MPSARFEAMLQSAFERSDRIFELLGSDRWLEQPILLRHPFIFYLGHLPAFAWNQVGRGGLQRGHLRADFDLLFERGIDPADETRARDAAIHRWPSVEEVLAYRNQARKAVLSCIPDVLSRKEDILCEHGRVLHLVIEHELMHQETLLYMLQEHAHGALRGEKPVYESGGGRQAQARRIPGGELRLGVDFESIEFGWDNEFGHRAEHLDDFFLDSLPVRNKDYLAFLQNQSQNKRQKLMPQAWLEIGAQRQVKTVFGPVPFELAEGWPVQVSGAQARAYCASKGGRLAKEAELVHASRGENGERVLHPNLGFRRWSPIPTGAHPESASIHGVEELVGNGWEWTSAAFEPLPGFKPYVRSYPGYSADFFDGEHDIVFGASWATDLKLARPSFRNWYRRDYPYVFSSFRVARDS